MKKLKEGNTNKNTANRDEKMKEERMEVLRRKTYYITELQVKQIALYHAYHDIDKSEIVRMALDKFFSDEIKKEAREKF